MAAFLPIFYAKSQLLPVPFKTHAAQKWLSGMWQQKQNWVKKVEVKATYYVIKNDNCLPLYFLFIT